MKKQSPTFVKLPVVNPQRRNPMDRALAPRDGFCGQRPDLSRQQGWVIGFPMTKPVAWAVVLNLMLNLVIALTAGSAGAQKRVAPSHDDSPSLTWDLGGSVGSYNGVSYSEINLGVNWFLQDYLIWRNSVFSRMPAMGESVQGLDTSLRLQHSVTSDDGSLGLGFFGGPGYRLSEAKSSALFGEVGVLVKLGGLRIGGGVKSFSYSNPGKDLNGVDLPKTDNVFFLILSGGGSL